MITELPQSEGATLGFEVAGKVSLDEENKWIDRLQQAIDQHGKVSVLVVLNEKARWSVHAGIEDLKWVITHMKNLHKVGVVSSSTVWKWLITIDGLFAPLAGIGDKHFETADIDEAWKWIKE